MSANIQPQVEKTTLHGDEKTAKGLLSSLATDLTELLRGEVLLAKAELRESVNDAKKGAMGLGIGTALVTAGTLTLIAFVVLGTAELFGIELWIAALIVGLVATGAGALLLKSSADKFSTDNLTPTRLQSSLEKDKNTIQEKFS